VATDDVRAVIVEDHADTRDMVMRLLELDGYNVRGASDACEALAVIAAHQPVCVILDLNLPDGCGIELARQLRAIYGTGTVIIVLTGSSRPEDQDAVELAGADYVLHKPLNAALLRRMLPRIE
jgi:DNA-binding response OmpR family regulator